MRLHRTLAASAALLALVACGDTTFPWTSDAAAGGPSFEVSPKQLAFTGMEGSAYLASQGHLGVEVRNGPVYLDLAWSGIVTAVSLDPASNALAVTVDAPAVAGTYHGEVRITGYPTSSGGQPLGGGPKVIPVTYQVTAMPLSATPATVALNAVAGAGPSEPGSVHVSLTPSGAWSTGITYGYGASGWLTATPSTGRTSPATVVLTAEFPSSTPAGTYQATLSVSSAYFTRDVTVTVEVARAAPPGLVATPAGVALTAVAGRTPLPAPAFLTVASEDGTYQGYGVTVDYGAGPAGWLTVPASGYVPGGLSVGLSTSNLAAGSYQAMLTLTPSSGGPPLTVPVTLDMARPPGVVATPAALVLDAVAGQAPLPAPASLGLAAEDGSSLACAATVDYGVGPAGWLTVAAGGTAPGSLAVGLATTALPAGTYQATLRLSSSAFATPRDVPVTLRLAAPPLTLDRAGVTFTVDAATTPEQTSTTVVLGDQGAPTAWSAVASQPWLHVTPASGATPATATLSLDQAALEALPPGLRTAEVLFTTPVAGGQVTGRLPVTFQHDLPLLTLVAPRIWVAGSGAEIRIRGEGALAALSGPIRFGALEDPSATVGAAGVIHATPPAGLAAGAYPVTMANALGLVRSTAQLVVVEPASIPAQALASTGAKIRVLWDELRQVLWVVNGGAGRLQRHRAAAGFQLAADGSDELALPGLRNAVLSPDHATLSVVTATQFLVVDPESVRATRSLPATFGGSVDLEMTSDGQAFLLEDPVRWVHPQVFDPATGTLTSLNTLWFYMGRLLSSADGEVLGLKETGISPEPSLILRAPDGDLSWPPGVLGVPLGLDRHGRLFLGRGFVNATTTAFQLSVLYDLEANGAVLPGTLPPTWISGAPPGALPQTQRAVFSPRGRGVAYTWDGAAVRSFDLLAAPDAWGVHQLVDSAFPIAAPGANAVMTISADERTAFLAGDDAVVVVPLP